MTGCNCAISGRDRKFHPSLLKPEYVQYEDPDGQIHKIIAVPAERYIGNEDARGGFGALQYPDVLGQVYNQIVETAARLIRSIRRFSCCIRTATTHGGGADSYYRPQHGANGAVVTAGDPRFELTTVE
jgi:hypothetical protein